MPVVPYFSPMAAIKNCPQSWALLVSVTYEDKLGGSPPAWHHSETLFQKAKNVSRGKTTTGWEHCSLHTNLPNTSPVLPFPTLKVPRSFWLPECSSTFSRPIFCYSNNSPKASSKNNLKQHNYISVSHKHEHLHAAGGTRIFTKLELQLASKVA